MLEAADAVVHDAALPPALLERCSADAHLEAPSQEPAEAAARLLDLARRYETVVRLCVGDALLDPAVVREVRAVAGSGTSFEVVPGVPSELAAACYAGVPVAPTAARSFILWSEDVSGGAESLALVRAPLARDGAVADPLRSAIAAALASRLGPEAAALLVSGPATPRQRTEATRLDDALARLRQGGVPPAVLLAGRGVEARRGLAWAERRPLFGRAVVVTRAESQADGLLRRLARMGAEPVAFPVIRIGEPADAGPLREAARDAGTFDWIVFTSANGVDRFWRALAEQSLDARALGGARVACIGPATAGALAARGVTADLVPERYVAESLLDAFRDVALDGARVLLPRAAEARSVLPDGLRARGADVVEVEAYRTRADVAGVAALRGRLARGEVDAVTFTSSSTVRSFVEAVGTDVGGAAVAVIGPITGATARELGLRVDVEAGEHTVDGLLDALVLYYERATGEG